ncbi:MAG: 30S ribosomal protein S16 [Candidatus Pacebacteria bacterium]|nr:30S ribosomal protein S16 [Candidatus Paceibacterota bacterium]
MLKIKLARFGKRNQPHYRIVINEAKSKRDGAYLEMIGRYVPAQQPKVLELDLERYDYWIEQGAQPTDTVASLADRMRSGEPFPEKKKKPSKKAQAKAKKEQEKEQEQPEAKKAEKEEGAKEQAKQEKEQAKQEKADKSEEK